MSSSAEIRQLMAADPRMPQRVRKFEDKTRPEDVPMNWYQMISLLAGVMSLMMRIKLAAWVALFSSFAMVANARTVEMDLKQIISSLAFGVIAVIMNYIGPQPPGTR